MEIQTIDNSIEKLIITGMIVSDKFLQDIQIIYNHDLMVVPYAKIVAKWCLDYWKEYKKSPGKHIQDIYNSQSRNGLGPDLKDLIGSFLESISQEYERTDHFNADYVLSQAEKRFKEKSIVQLSEDLIAFVSQGKIREAETMLTDYKRIERPQTSGINPLTNREAIYKAFEMREENILFTFPGILGKFVGPIERSSFTAILAAEKKGKSWTLFQFALWALKARCNVAFFEVGDMVEEDSVRRFHMNNTRSSDRVYGEIVVPILDCFHNQTNDCIKKERLCQTGVLIRSAEAEDWKRRTIEDATDYRPCIACQNSKDFKGSVWYRKENIPQLTWKQAWEMGKKTMERVGDKQFKFSTFFNDSINVRGIESQLDQWEQMEGFIPDVVFIDYADILASMDSRLDERGKQNATWQSLRALSQKRFCALFTATQANAASYDKESLEENNFSEDKRKYSHATGFLTLNQTPEEKRAGIMRIGKMFYRESKYDIKKFCTVLQCLDIGKPYLNSYL